MIPTKLSIAMAAQKAIDRQFYEWMVKHDTLLHRAEMLLDDNIEFDFAHACLTDMEYAFLHLYTSTLCQILDGTGETITFPKLIRVLQSAAVTIQSVERKDKEDKNYNPRKDNISFLPRQELTPVEQMCYDLIPLLLLFLSTHPQYEKECHGEWWRENVLTNCLQFITLSHTLLLNRGLGDRA